MAKKRPEWFQEWLDNEFSHFVIAVKLNKKLMTLLIAIVVATFVRVFVG